MIKERKTKITDVHLLSEKFGTHEIVDGSRDYPSCHSLMRGTSVKFSGERPKNNDALASKTLVPYFQYSSHPDYQNVDHVFIFITDDQEKMIRGKMTTRFWQADVNFKAYRSHYTSETHSDVDYTKSEFERRREIVGFRSVNDAVAFRNLVMDERNYTEAATNFQAAMKRGWYSLDEIYIRQNFLLGIPVPNLEKLLTFRVWENPDINIFKFSLEECKVKYIEIPVIPDKTLFSVAEAWEVKKSALKGASRLVGSGDLESLVDYEGTPQMTVTALSESTLPELLEKRRALAVKDNEIDFSKVLNEDNSFLYL